MATLLSAIRTQARRHIIESTALFWSDDELLDIILNGARDMWGSIAELNEEHFLTVDVTNVSLAASGTTLTGVPADTLRVHIIEPRDTTDAGASRSITFIPREYNSPDFTGARTATTFDPAQGGVIYYCVTQAGAPVAAPTVLVAPSPSTAINLRFAYIPTLSTSLTAASNNPIPGESDQALVNWTVAYARAKEREDRAPDPAWFRAYQLEKDKILLRLTPRQDQEPTVAAAVFEREW